MSSAGLQVHSGLEEGELGAAAAAAGSSNRSYNSYDSNSPVSGGTDREPLHAQAFPSGTVSKFTPVREHKSVRQGAWDNKSYLYS